MSKIKKTELAILKKAVKIAKDVFGKKIVCLCDGCKIAFDCSCGNHICACGHFHANPIDDGKEGELAYLYHFKRMAKSEKPITYIRKFLKLNPKDE